MRRMSHHRLRWLGWRSLVQWRVHLGQCLDDLYALAEPAAAAAAAAAVDAVTAVVACDNFGQGYGLYFFWAI